MPISITRVYTRLGDQGETALVGGRRVPKDSPRIVAYGTVDELNAAVGLVRVFNAERLRVRSRARARHVWLDATLRKIQNQLFDLGSELATPPDAAYEGMFRIGAGEVTELERLMDECQKSLSPPAPSAAAPSARSWPSPAWSQSPSGPCATSTASATSSSSSAAGPASTWAKRSTTGNAASAPTSANAAEARVQPATPTSRAPPTRGRVCGARARSSPGVAAPGARLVVPQTPPRTCLARSDGR
jgi:cob(I)alamin adenosyltransferase